MTLTAETIKEAYTPKTSALALGAVKAKLLIGVLLTSDPYKKHLITGNASKLYSIGMELSRDLFSVKTARKCHFICMLWEQMDFDIIDVSSKNLH